MRQLEISARQDTDTSWTIEIYNPNIGGVVLERTRTFESRGLAECWFETVATLEKGYEHSLIGKLQDTDIPYAEADLGFRYQDVI